MSYNVSYCLVLYMQRTIIIVPNLNMSLKDSSTIVDVIILQTMHVILRINSSKRLYYLIQRFERRVLL